ncbi:MAG: hypothetical protein ABSD20_12675 [Terriglobales bacterium]|jgi:signal transduction histidine kinase
MEPSSPPAPSRESHAEAAQQVVHARHLLERLRERLEKDHPELDEALEKLESALNLLTIKTGGML